MTRPIHERPRCCRNASPLLAAQGRGAAHVRGGSPTSTKQANAKACRTLLFSSDASSDQPFEGTAGDHGVGHAHWAGGVVSKNSPALAAAFSGGAASKKRGHQLMVRTDGPGRAVSETTGPPGTTPGGRGVRRASRSARPMRVTKFRKEDCF
jgi:hypothetical protein